MIQPRQSPSARNLKSCVKGMSSTKYQQVVLCLYILTIIGTFPLPRYPRTRMADAVSQVHNLSRTEVDLVNSIKQMLDENTVDITRKFSWGHQYGSKELRSVTDKLKAEISKKRTVSWREVTVIHTEILTGKGCCCCSFKIQSGCKDAQGYDDNRTRTIDSHIHPTAGSRRRSSCPCR